MIQFECEVPITVEELKKKNFERSSKTEKPKLQGSPTPIIQISQATSNN